MNGDGFKDTTREGEIVFVWNVEKEPPYAPGQYPRIGNEVWSASVNQYNFMPATASDLPAILASLSASNDSNAMRDALTKARRELYLLSAIRI